MANRKRSIEEIRKMDFLKLSDFAEFNNVRYSTVKFYVERGLLPFVEGNPADPHREKKLRQRGRKLMRYFPRVEASRRLQTILKLREKGKTVEQIREYIEQGDGK
ncbi:MAG: helix-turn-helix domain-containing protein [Candidatus Sumerlaeia bacterium]